MLTLTLCPNLSLIAALIRTMSFAHQLIAHCLIIQTSTYKLLLTVCENDLII